MHHMKPLPMGGGGGMMKTVHRAIRAATGGHGSSQQPFSHSNFNHNCTTNPPTSKPTYKPSSSSSSSNNYSNTLSFSPVNHPNSTGGEEYDGGHGWFYDDSVFTTVPSMDEVDYAISSLQQVLDLPTGSHESGLELDWIEPSRSMMLQSRVSQSVYDAFHLLQTEPSVKRMVISLSSDKSVWEAVMNNEMVRELRDSVYEAKTIESCHDDSIPVPVPVPDVRSGIFTNTKAKVMEIVEKITEIVNKLFQSPKNENKGEEKGAAIEPFEKKLRSSLCLSVMVILIIVVSRVYRS